MEPRYRCLCYDDIAQHYRFMGDCGRVVAVRRCGDVTDQKRRCLRSPNGAVGTGTVLVTVPVGGARQRFDLPQMGAQGGSNVATCQDALHSRWDLCKISSTANSGL
ncbi:UNVERIFIED_CONTAM: hypothetical protein FKN15_028974 [Acipenser sinensis]